MVANCRAGLAGRDQHDLFASPGRPFELVVDATHGSDGAVGVEGAGHGDVQRLHTSSTTLKAPIATPVSRRIHGANSAHALSGSP